jgi:nucleotide-binding universal stress UspA family protein
VKLLDKVLLATDFTRASKDALLMTIRLAEMFHSEIILIHVIPEAERSPVRRVNARKIAAEKLKHIRGDLNRKGISSVQTIIRSGIPFEAIIEQSEELDVNLIVLGSAEEQTELPLGHNGFLISGRHLHSELASDLMNLFTNAIPIRPNFS